MHTACSDFLAGDARHLTIFFAPAARRDHGPINPPHRTAHETAEPSTRKKTSNQVQLMKVSLHKDLLSLLGMYDSTQLAIWGREGRWAYT